MMQQFATSSSKLAIGGSAMDMTHTKTDVRDFKHTFDDSRSTFEKAIADAEQRALVNPKLFDKDGDLSERAFTQPVIRDGDASDASANAIAENTDARENSGNTDAAGEAMSLDGETSALDRDLENTSGPDTEFSALNADESASVSANQYGEIVPETEQLEAEPSELTFDYIKFVTLVQTLNDAGETVTATQAISNSKDEQNIDLSIVNLDVDEQSLDLSNISLTEDELQVILDAQQANLDLQGNLSEEQLAKLSDVIHKMLSQFHQQNNAKDTEDSQALAGDALDVKLIETMISQPSKKSMLDKQVAQDLDASVVPNAAKDDQSKLDEAILTVSSAASNSKELLLTPKEEEQLFINSDVDQSNKSKLAQDVHKQGETASIDDAPASASAMTKEAISPDFSLTATTIASFDDKAGVRPQKPVTAESIDLAKQLAMLDERSQTNIIDNIKSRVEKFAADLSGNSTKGSEFVAAMQSGLKEFKEQLLTGREPGIDLKALISDAMSQANVELNAQTQTKVDAALNQFANLMSLANGVNQSTQAQAHQLFGLTESQIIKESHAMHTEGTKLAQQTPTSFDKAVNIFKADGQQQLTEKVRWMVNARNPAAEIRLDPPELGSMQIKINMTADSAAVSFTVQSAAAKEALDQALPKLRDMLQEQGIELGQSSVEQQASGQSQQQDQQSGSAHTSTTSGRSDSHQATEVDASSVIEQRVVGSHLGGIDFYA